MDRFFVLKMRMIFVIPERFYKIISVISICSILLDLTNKPMS